jgi:P27 family predicted phage terminase small subunit
VYVEANPIALDKWNEKAPQLYAVGILTALDGDALADYCIEHAHMVECENFVRENGDTMTLRDDKGNIKWIQTVPQEIMRLKHLEKCRQFLTEFGMTPSSRSRIHAQPAKNKSSIEVFLYDEK